MARNWTVTFEVETPSASATHTFTLPTRAAAFLAVRDLTADLAATGTTVTACKVEPAWF